MKNLTFSLIATVVFLAVAPLTGWAGPSAGCGTEGWSSGTYTMQHRGITRRFRVHVPTGYTDTDPAPLIAYFHGWGGNEDEILGEKTVTSQADKRGYILAAPRGLGSGDPDNSYNSWSFSGSTTGVDGESDAICDAGITPDYSYASCAAAKTNSCSWTQCQANDVDFAVALVHELEQNLCVNTGRVYATGGSNGGMFTWELGQNPHSAPAFRAIAPLIGLPHRGYLDAKGKPGDMPALLITGTQDDVVPPGEWEDPSFTTTSNDNDRFYYTGATAITRSWAAAHNCDILVDAIAFDDEYPQSDCRTYCSDDPGWPRVLDCRAKMGHTYSLTWSWKLVLDFFDAHSD